MISSIFLWIRHHIESQNSFLTVFFAIFFGLITLFFLGVDIKNKINRTSKNKKKEETNSTNKKSHSPSTDIWVIWGLNQNFFASPGTKDKPTCIIKWKDTKGNEIEVLKGYLENGKLYVTTVLYGNPKIPEVIIVNNQNTISSISWDKNFNDTALEIVDENHIPRLQLIYRDSRHVMINGIFNVRNGVLIIAGKDIEFYYQLPVDLKLKRIFKYPYRRYKGQEVDEPHF